MNPGIEKITKITIPDEDMRGWIETLFKEGFKQEEIDLILGHLSKEYARIRGIDSVEKRLTDFKKYFLEEHGKTMTLEQEEYFRRNIQRKMDSE